MKHTLPSTLMVLGEPFRVELVHELRSDGDRVSGETVGEFHRIRIDAGLDSTRQWQTLIHEYVHAVLHVVGVGNFLDAATEEVIAQSLEYGIVQLMREHGPAVLKATIKEKK